MQAPLGLILHETKRFIKQTSVGFDIPGYTLHSIRRLHPAAGSVRRLKIRTRRLYKQGASTTRLCAVCDSIVQLVVGRGLRTR
ncbi:MAG: hypothetical protein NTV68_01120 [Methanomicrobiales archaeon]|nr:hypothetical protein [Methanomicrobiales archaeon]